MVETQLCKLRGTLDTFVGRAYSIFIYNMVFMLTTCILTAYWVDAHVVPGTMCNGFLLFSYNMDGFFFSVLFDSV